MTSNNQEYYGSHIFIGQKSFRDIENFPYVHTCLIFVKLGYLGFTDHYEFISHEPYNDRDKGMWTIIKPPLQEILSRHIILENYILDVILDERYKEIRIQDRKGDLMIERTIDHNSEDTKFVELQKKYPHSEIKAKNYNGKTTKYEVKEKIKLSKNEQE